MHWLCPKYPDFFREYLVSDIRCYTTYPEFQFQSKAMSFQTLHRLFQSFPATVRPYNDRDYLTIRRFHQLIQNQLPRNQLQWNQSWKLFLLLFVIPAESHGINIKYPYKIFFLHEFLHLEICRFNPNKFYFLFYKHGSICRLMHLNLSLLHFYRSYFLSCYISAFLAHTYR